MPQQTPPLGPFLARGCRHGCLAHENALLGQALRSGSRPGWLVYGGASAAAGSVPFAAARRRARRKALPCGLSTHCWAPRGRHCLRDSLRPGELHVSLVEGLGPDVATRFNARRAQEVQIAKHVAELHPRLGGNPVDSADIALRICRLHERYDFLKRLDALDHDVAHASASDIRVVHLRGPATEISPKVWDAMLGPEDSMFLEHSFLAGLEKAGCVSVENGWQPRFLVARIGDIASKGAGLIVGAVPLYLKMHSDGEFCEENEWIDAASQLGIRHWPRLFIGVPFTPHQGRRLITAFWLGTHERALVRQTLLRSLSTISSQAQVSVNIAFNASEEDELLKSWGFVCRVARQSWWMNRQPTPYLDFDDFLSTLRVKNARTIIKQREAVKATPGLHIQVIDGSRDAAAISADLMAEVFRLCYAPTQMRHGNFSSMEGSDNSRFDLNEAFFRHLGEHFAHRVVLILARQASPTAPSTDDDRGRLAAGALCFAKGRKLCGRYWGYPLDAPAVPFLHFECCYHMLIEHAILRGYTQVEPGNGGGTIYKVQRYRGFKPVLTPSHHLIHDLDLRTEVARLAALSAQEVPPWTTAKHSAYTGSA